MLSEPLRLTATQVLEVSRELAVDEWSARQVVFRLEVDHPNPEELSVVLRRPDGEIFSVRPTVREETFTVRFNTLPPTDTLRGVWRLSLADTGGTANGRLVRWGVGASTRSLTVDRA